ncbi:sugar transferase [Cohnella fermenti]|uniref:Sugar transferase n=1 Tax=Cohnella fermenti TaxID=2565925 RepID=A0A4S4BZV2_9BACL|nr:sugar transferase [Cohnella fermenti]THF80858.1 sugar transferase [Cohnella fermenti]
MNLGSPIKHPQSRMADNDGAAQLARRKSHTQAKLKRIQTVLLTIELSIYLLTYMALFVYKVLPDYPRAKLYSFWNWPRLIPVLDDYLLFFLGYMSLFFLVLYQKHYYRLDQDKKLSDELGRVVSTAIICFLIAVGVTFLLKNTLTYSRLLLMTYLMLVIVESCMFRQWRNKILIGLKKSGVIKQNALIIGAGKVGRQLEAHMAKGRSFVTLVGFLDDKATSEDILGRVHDLERVLFERRVDILYITIPSERGQINPLLSQLNKYAVDIRIIPEQFDHISPLYEYRDDHGFPCLQIVKTPLRGINLVIKRWVDVIVAAASIILLSPILVSAAAIIKATSEGPVLHSQERIGKNSLPFRMHKFRTMVANAEAMKPRLMKKNEATGPVFKMRNDPRVTRAGRFLRKYSIDELPQLINVLRGEMSLIGPRPPLPEEAAKYSNEHWRRMDVRPGMTGLWQVSGRSDLSFDEWIDLDIQYIERWSLGLELKIILKTIPVVIKGNGAY